MAQHYKVGKRTSKNAFWGQKKPTWWLIVGGLVVIVGMFWIAANVLGREQAITHQHFIEGEEWLMDVAIDSGRIKLSQFYKIQAEMTYEDVVKVFGGQGTLMSESNIAGYNTVVYMWQNSDGGNAMLTFQNGRLYSKSQFGLR